MNLKYRLGISPAALADIVPSIQKPEAYFNSNVIGTLNVIQASLNIMLNDLFILLLLRYGIQFYPTKETAPISCQYPYALTKRLGEEIVLHWSSLYSLPALSLDFLMYMGQDLERQNLWSVFEYFLLKN